MAMAVKQASKIIILGISFILLPFFVKEGGPDFIFYRLIFYMLIFY